MTKFLLLVLNLHVHFYAVSVSSYNVIIRMGDRTVVQCNGTGDPLPNVDWSRFSDPPSLSITMDTSAAVHQNRRAGGTDLVFTSVSYSLFADSLFLLA